MNLGELEFKAEDFEDCWYRLKTLTMQDCAARANAVLREKLAKAPDVEGWWSGRYFETGDVLTHRARLVCIEELKP